VDDSHRLDPRQFRKMVRMLQERDMECYHQAFDDHDPYGLKVIGLAEAVEAYGQIGFLSIKADSVPADWSTQESGGLVVYRDDFLRACLKSARQVRETIKKNGGWTDLEVEELHLIFQRYDSNRTGRISKGDLIQLVEDVVPELAKPKSMRPQLLELLRQVDQNGTGSLKFADFLKLMGLFRDFKDKERLRKEQQAVKDSGFSNQEVAEFRELFLNSLGDSHDLAFEEFREMIHRITPLGDALTAELEEIFCEVCNKQPEADFPDFLLLLKRLLDCNFARIKEKTSGSLRR